EGHRMEAQLLGRVCGVMLGGEVAAVAAPVRDGVDHPVDELADACLALGAAWAASEVLLGDDVDRQLRPGAGDLDVLLLEDDLAFLAGDDGRPAFPLHEVVGMAAWRREETAKAKTLGLAAVPVPVAVLGTPGSGEVGEILG